MLKNQGITLDKRETVQFAFGSGVLVGGTQTADKKVYRKWLLVAQAGDLTALVNVQVPEQETAYPEAAMRAALMTLALRATRAGLRAAQPAAVHGRRYGRLPCRERAAGPRPGVDRQARPACLRRGRFRTLRMFLSLLFPAAPVRPTTARNFARLAFDQIVGIKEVKLTMSEPLRINGQSGFQTMAQAKDARTNADIMVVQWLRFGGGAFMQMIGMAKADGWTTTLTRLRTIRDSIDAEMIF